MQKIVFIVTSVIHFNEKPLSYSSTRSLFSPEERLSQTKETIASIRRHVPTAHIILAEMGTKTVIQEFHDLVDTYLYLGNNHIVRFACDGKYKGLGEVTGILYTLPVLKKIQCDVIFKISGRYVINDAFSLKEWLISNKCTFVRNGGVFSTRLYCIPVSMVHIWKWALIKSIPLLFKNESLESMMMRHISKGYISLITTAGVSGNVAPTGDSITE